MKDFNDIYYNSVECVRCSLCLDRCPAVRAVGTDKAPMYSAVYSALGSRFDLEMVTEEAFQCIDCYECESACPVNVPIADTMAYIRRLCREKNTVPEAVTDIVHRAEAGENILGKPQEIREGKAYVAVFLGYAGELDVEMQNAFDKICKAAGISYTFLTDTADSGYFLDRSGQTEGLQKAVDTNVKAFERGQAKVIVTPCSYSFEAFQNYYPEKYTYLHTSEFLEDLLEKKNLNATGGTEQTAYHAAHMLTRKNEVKAPEELIVKLSGQKAVQPERTGYRTSSSGLGGGLGLFYPELAAAVSKKRAKELADLGCRTVVTGCVFEKYALKEAIKEKDMEIIDITEYVARAL